MSRYFNDNSKFVPYSNKIKIRFTKNRITFYQGKEYDIIIMKVLNVWLLFSNKMKIILYSKLKTQIIIK